MVAVVAEAESAFFALFEFALQASLIKDSYIPRWSGEQAPLSPENLGR